MNTYLQDSATTPETLAPLVTFAAYAIRSEVSDSPRLSVSNAFTSLAIISLVTSPMVQLLASLSAIGIAKGCIKRIETFLISTEKNSSQVGSEKGAHVAESDSMPEQQGTELSSLKGTTAGEASHEPLLLEINKLSLRPSQTSETLIENAQFSLQKSSLTMILGPVGAGKTTLLNAILGELTCESGTINLHTQSISFCTQSPWLPNGTFRQVLCGPATYDPSWYRTVVEACDLEKDLSELVEGDRTVIGSRGSVLSGGQRQRLVSSTSDDGI